MPPIPKDPKKPKGKARHKEMVKQQVKIKERMQADHEAYIAKVKKDHDDFMANSEAPVFDVFQNATDEPIVLDNGAIIPPGFYYVETEETQFGIGQEEYERMYEEVT